MKGFPENLQQIFEKAQQMQSELAKVKDEAEKKEVEASAGGGMVVVKMTGGQRLTSVKIDKTVINTDDVQMLEDLVRAAVNEALHKSAELVKTEISKLTGGIPIPGL